MDSLEGVLPLGLVPGEIVLWVVPSGIYGEATTRIVASLSRNKTVCYVTLNKPYETLSSRLEREGANLENVFFVDTVTLGASGKSAVEPENVVFLSSSSSFTELSVAIREAMESGEFDFLFFDAISTLCIYNDENTISEFVHDVVNRIRKTESGAVLVVIGDENNSGIVDRLGMFVDRTVTGGP